MPTEQNIKSHSSYMVAQIRARVPHATITEARELYEQVKFEDFEYGSEYYKKCGEVLANKHADQLTDSITDINEKMKVVEGLNTACIQNNYSAAFTHISVCSASSEHKLAMFQILETLCLMHE
ncbi:hypothetical protein PLEI_1468 [Photobacterium leiognathi lrivu.4.1]|uniref:Uncharacterized protein n=1 Tax=Photobacterium leiognathi lrivu.4.1 TaxID=1248232 RepID=A0A0U1P5T2_PHOLE|nr:hypothetical protein [Photobacterium leiognathi]GAD29815.1 hypothetical protein PLEI_1468 [Photobacterium leiognathi lrivu.4.1]